MSSWTRGTTDALKNPGGVLATSTHMLDESNGCFPYCKEVFARGNAGDSWPRNLQRGTMCLMVDFSLQAKMMYDAEMSCNKVRARGVIVL
jgi:hypothetical protein